MAAGFTNLLGETATHASSTSEDTVGTVDAEVGDIAGLWLEATTEVDPHLDSGGATWSVLDSTEPGSSGDMFAVYRCTAAGTDDNVTISQDFDGFTGWALIIVRPTDLDYVGIANNSGSIDETDSGGDLTVTLSAGPFDALLGIGGHTANGAWNLDSGWSNADEERDDAFTLRVDYRTSDDSEWVADPASGTGHDIAALVLEFSDAAAGGPAGINKSRINRGRINSGLINRSWEKVGRLWTRPTLIPVGIQIGVA